MHQSDSLRPLKRTQPTEPGKTVHRRAGDQIDLVERLLQYGHSLRHAARHICALRHEQEFLILPDGDELIILSRIRNGKLLSVSKRHRFFKRKLPPRKGGLPAALAVLRRSAGAERQRGQCGKQRAQKAFHPFTSALEASNVSVYSISCGVLMAVVSPMTASGVSSAETGTSNVEPSSFESAS